MVCMRVLFLFHRRLLLKKMVANLKFLRYLTSFSSVFQMSVLLWIAHAANKDDQPKNDGTKDPTQPDVKSLNLTVIGCFKDNGNDFRPFPYVKHQINFFIYNDWNNMTDQIKTCRDTVKAKSFKYFGFQFYGECWYGPPLRVNYKKDGNATNCIGGAGLPPNLKQNRTGSLMVYRIND